ncbi:MAG: SocA family protein [Coleofasciculaceae cyanobacterium SM2_1_6]|nr:SocA family protein [Coleofasciculaceae cyanobacterium SM2_1_6]
MTPIKFRLHPQKTVEAAAMLLKLHGNSMKYLGLLKMLYIADRIALERMEQPITGDCAYSMKYGPVLSGVYDLIKGNPVGDALPLWRSFFLTKYPKDHTISLLADPGDDHLCEEEEEIIQKVYAEFGHLDPFDVAEWTHGLPEWQKPRENSCIPIVVDDVLRYLDKTDEDIEYIRQIEAREAYLDGVLATQ